MDKLSQKVKAMFHDRPDPWYLEWILMGSALTVLLLYSTWATFQGNNYAFGPYRSPFYPFDFKIGRFSPALMVFWIPVIFRLTCYYWRKVYYRNYFLDPAGCAVSEIRENYTGERVFPFILQNLHRYCVYLALVLLLFHWKETISSFYYHDSLGIGVGNIILLTDSVFLTIYVSSCHALRHLVGGSINQYSCSSCSRVRYHAWNFMSILNERHGVWAWISLVTVIAADIYVRLLSSGAIHDINTWGSF